MFVIVVWPAPLARTLCYLGLGPFLTSLTAGHVAEGSTFFSLAARVGPSEQDLFSAPLFPQASATLAVLLFVFWAGGGQQGTSGAPA